jgi:outer membrane immunogenic protein
MAVVGGTLGANFQASTFVFGVEGDWDYSAINPAPPRASAPSAAVARLATIGWRQRAGAPAMPPIACCFISPPVALSPMVQTNFNGVTTTHTQSGWTAGGGIEWAFTDNWTAKVEYLYVNLGKAA